LAGATFDNFLNVDLNTIAAIADGRLQNLSLVTTSGVDFEISYKTRVQSISFETGIDGTKILRFSNKFSSVAPELDSLNTTNNPVDLRLRAREIVGYGDLSLALFVNYTDSYSNNQVVPAVPVSSWITEDINASYRFGRGMGALGNLSATVGVTNVANRSPPFVQNLQYPIYFDGANANPLGRFVYAQLVKRF
jgi:iron complex outermembrane receptor protein